jgi:hypothetical protein
MDSIDQIGGVLGALIGAAAVGTITYNSLRRTRREACGFWPWEAKRMRREGMRATAEVLSRTTREMHEVGYREYELIVEVRPQGAPSFRTTVVYVGGTFDNNNREGEQMPVLFRPGEPSRLLIDFAAMERAATAAAGEAQAREEQRKRDLLAGKGP